jgi:hypothetical protein
MGYGHIRERRGEDRDGRVGTRGQRGITEKGEENSPLNLRIFIFNKCPIFTNDGASAKVSINSHTKRITV